MTRKNLDIGKLGMVCREDVKVGTTNLNYFNLPEQGGGTRWRGLIT
jgi:hypothetical protein